MDLGILKQTVFTYSYFMEIYILKLLRNYKFILLPIACGKVYSLTISLTLDSVDHFSLCLSII